MRVDVWRGDVSCAIFDRVIVGRKNKNGDPREHGDPAMYGLVSAFAFLLLFCLAPRACALPCNRECRLWVWGTCRSCVQVDLFSQCFRYPFYPGGTSAMPLLALHTACSSTRQPRVPRLQQLLPL